MLKSDICELYCSDAEKVNQVKKKLAAKNTLETVKFMKALADESRIKIIYALCQEKELCVCDLTEIIGSSIANTSHHLQFLKNRGLVKSRKEGKQVFYSLVDELVKKLILVAMDDIRDEK